jgi:hypothetical protein
MEAVRTPAVRPLRRLLAENLGVTTLLFALLECRRPFYFLTDDNLDGGFPLLASIGRRLARGESPFVSDDVFGGHYDLLRDGTNFCWHPLYLLAALLANTPARLGIVDLIALVLVLLTAAGFVCLAHFVRAEFQLSLGDARLMLCAQSYTFSMVVLCLGSSWFDFLANYSALPWLALGILQTEWRRGLGLITLFSLHDYLGGHPAGTVSNTLFLTLFAAGVALCRGSAKPLLCWIAGCLLAAVIISPLLMPAASGFAQSARASGLDAADLSRYAMPARLLPLSWFLGVFSSYFHIDYRFGYCPPWYTAAFASCAAAWVLVPALASRAPWRRWELLSLGLAGLAAFAVTRPDWLGALMAHLPLLRSMRWPFRELVQLVFFLHLFLILRPLGGPPAFQRVIILLGIFLYVCPLFFLPPPSLNAMETDRRLLLSGDAGRYWEKIRPLLKPGEVIVPVINPALTAGERANAPFSLIGAYNYPMLFEVVSATGYSTTAPRDQLYLTEPPFLASGVYLPAQETAIARERPNVRFITLESIRPLRITLSSPAGPPIDVTPLAPAP